jgi:RNA polymerase sigma factor for flagellar operon FliA
MESSDALQQRLIEGNLDLVRRIANDVHRLVHRKIEVDELINMGTIGLIDPARRYDPQRGFQFSTFAYYRIKGVILDGVRNQWHQIGRPPRLVAEEASNAYLQEKSLPLQRGGPSPSTGELVERLSSTLSRLTTCYHLSSDGLDTLPDPGAQDGYAEVERDSDLAWIRSRVSELPAQWRDLVTAVYEEGRSLEEFARLKGRSKSWACRLHARVIDQLRGSSGVQA